MKKTLFYTGTFLLIIWLTGFFLFKASPEIHALLMLSLILLIRSSFICPKDRVPNTAG